MLRKSQDRSPGLDNCTAARRHRTSQNVRHIGAQTYQWRLGTSQLQYEPLVVVPRRVSSVGTVNIALVLAVLVTALAAGFTVLTAIAVPAVVALLQLLDLVLLLLDG